MPVGRSRPPHPPRPQARHRRRGAGMPGLRRPGALAAALLAVVLGLGALGALGTVSHLSGNVTTAPLRAEGSGGPRSGDGADLNILLLGSDSRDLGERSYGEPDGSRRSDAMVLAHLSAANDRIDVVQLPRDTLMTLPACEDTGSGRSLGGRGMLNSALNHGASCSVAAVEELTGVRVDHFVELDFEGFIDIVDALGGLPVCLDSALEDPHADLDLPAGPQTVDGTDALALARTRHAVGDGSDIARLDHQQMVMSALVQEATGSHLLSRPDRLYSFLEATTSALTVDPGLSSLTDMSALGRRAAQVPAEDITFMTMPWEPAPSDPNRVVPAPEASEVFGKLASDAPLTAPAAPQAPSPPQAPSRGEPSEEAPSSSARPQSGAPADDTPVTIPGTRAADADLCGG